MTTSSLRWCTVVRYSSVGL